jgi:hypothetical protein
MSTNYVPNKEILFSELKTFSHKGVIVDTIHEDGSVILTDGGNYLYAYPSSEIETYKIRPKHLEFVSSHPYEGVIFTRYGVNDPTRIIGAIEDFFKVRLISEHEDEYGEIVSR